MMSRTAWHRAGVAAFAAAVVVCLMWTVWLLVLTVSPNATVNKLMDTTKLESGLFWLFADSPPTALALGVVGLTGVAVGHALVLGQLMKTPTETDRVQPFHADDSDSPSIALKLFPDRVRQLTYALVDAESEGRKKTVVPLKLLDLALQTVLLVQLLESGIPIPLLVLLSVFVTSNALCFAVLVSIPHSSMGTTHLFLDFISDFAVAVVFMIIVVCYSMAMFTLDRHLMEINLSVFPLGSFEHAASLIANPVEVDIIRHAIDALRIDTLPKAFTRVGTSMALLYHVYQFDQLLRSRKRWRHRPSIYPSKNHRVGALFGAIAIGVAVITERSITTSSAACETHLECAQIARHWIFNLQPNEFNRCPCIAIVDRDIAVATFDAWNHPPDRTEKLVQLALPGYLRTIQFVNRGLRYLPGELRSCHSLRRLSLYYAGNLTLPDWFKDFSKLEVLHIEGQNAFRSLGPLPEGLFDKMHSLRLIHLASHVIESLPSLDPLVNLESLFLAGLRKIVKLPSFTSLHNLKRLVLNSMHGIQSIPNLDATSKLKTFISVDRGAYCCDGFLGPDRCNLTHSLCQKHPISGAPAITQCLPPNQQASTKTRSVFDRFHASVCFDEALQPGQRKGNPTLLEMLQCNGTLYRACQMPGTNVTAMCYNARWMAVTCDPSPFSIEMRRQQIAQRRGVRCNPLYEAWLGCKAS